MVNLKKNPGDSKQRAPGNTQRTILCINLCLITDLLSSQIYYYREFLELHGLIFVLTLCECGT